MRRIEEALKYLQSHKSFRESEICIGESIFCPKQKVMIEINKKKGKYEAVFLSVVNINQVEAEVIANVLMLLNS